MLTDNDMMHTSTFTREADATSKQMFTVTAALNVALTPARRHLFRTLTARGVPETEAEAVTAMLQRAMRGAATAVSEAAQEVAALTDALAEVIEVANIPTGVVHVTGLTVKP